MPLILLFCLFLLPIIAQANETTHSVNVSVVTDWDTVQVYGSVENTRQAIVNRFNLTREVYQNQLDVELVLTYIDIPDYSGDDFVPQDTKVEQLAFTLTNYRSANPNHYAADVTVLMSIRDLRFPNNVVGYANIGSLCQANAVAMIEVTTDTDQDSRVFAHELGHVFGAEHDTGLMSAAYAAYATSSMFSQYSVDQIKSRFSQFQCLNPIAIPTPTVAPLAQRSSGGGGGCIELWFLVVMVGLVVIRQIVN